MGYFKDAVKGVSWMSAFRVTYRALGILRISIIAHILSPYSLGVFGIATISLGFLEILTETGINVFLIQEKEDIDNYINSAWLVSIIRGVIISIIVVATAGFVSVFFDSPDAKNLLYLVSLVPLIRGFINPSVIKFQKSLEFNKEFYYRISIYFVESAVSVMFALILKNPLGLVLGLIGGSIFEVVYTFAAARPLPRFVLDTQKIIRVIKRGIWVTLYGIFDYVYTNADNIIVGRMLGVSPLGIYQNAYKISTIPLTEIGNVFFKVTFPLFSRISDDTERLKKGFVKNMIVNTVLMTVTGVLIFLFASPLVKILFGPGWELAIPVVKLLSVLGVTRGIAASAYSLLVAKTKQNYCAVVTFISAAGLLLTIVPLVNKYGIMGAGLSAIIGTLVSLPLTVYYVYKIFKNS